MLLSPLLTGIPLTLLPALPAAAASVSPPPGPDAPAEQQPPSSFSLAAAKQPGRQGNFVRDWVAARQKWGGAIPDLTAKAFSLLDDGEHSPFPLPLPLPLCLSLSPSPPLSTHTVSLRP